MLIITGAFWWNARTQTVAPREAPLKTSNVAKSEWQVVAPGVEFRAWRLGDGGARLVALRVKPERVRVVVGTARESEAWRRDNKAVAALNGGYFDEQGRSLGLRVSRGGERQALRRADWGVFCVRSVGKRRVAQILHTRDFHVSPNVQEAVQCGPRLVVNGRATDLKPQIARRSGVGITDNGLVVLAACDDPIPFARWAQLWQSRDALNCPNALNLDGGGSTQLSLRAPQRTLDLRGNWAVPDALLVQ